MVGDWPVLSLREAGVGLLDCEHRTPPSVEDGFPYIAIPQIKDGRIVLTDVRRISREDFLTWTRKTRPEPWDVILSRRCNPGETAFVHPGLECALGQNLVLLRANGERVLPAFLRWLVRSPAWWDQVRNFINVGAVFDSLTCADIPNFRLPVPPLQAQRAIAHILGTLDDKIELNRRVSQTLEAIARAIFQSWFVDFDPVRAKAAGQQPAGLAPDIADLFPDGFEESELGKIPRGWEVHGLDEIATFVNGLALQNYPPEGGCSLPVIKISQLRKGNTDDADLASADIDPAYIVEDGDLLFSWSGSLECVLWTGGPGALNQHLFTVTSDAFQKWYCYLWILEHLEGFRQIAAGKATTMGHIQRYHLAEARVLSPPRPLLDQMDGVMSPLVDAIISRGVECRTLEAVRDALLPKLISGEMRVPYAERVLEEAKLC